MPNLPRFGCKRNSKDGLRRPQDGSKTFPDGPRSRESQDAPQTAQVGVLEVGPGAVWEGLGGNLTRLRGDLENVVQPSSTIDNSMTIIDISRFRKGLGGSLGGAKTSRDGPKIAQEAPKTVQEGPQTAQDVPKMAQDRFQDGTRGSQNGLKGSQDAPKTPQDHLPGIGPGSRRARGRTSLRPEPPGKGVKRGYKYP